MLMLVGVITHMYVCVCVAKGHQAHTLVRSSLPSLLVTTEHFGVQAPKAKGVLECRFTGEKRRLCDFDEMSLDQFQPSERSQSVPVVFSLHFDRSTIGFDTHITCNTPFT